LGTPGPHPYLAGKAEAIAVFDSVRAAHHLAQAGAGTTFAVWGVSQGGHAALFTGQYAASYAPDLQLAGVAPAAPATALIPLFQRSIGKDFGNVLSAFAFDSWTQVYDNLKPDQIVTAVARSLVRSVTPPALLADDNVGRFDDDGHGIARPERQPLDGGDRDAADHLLPAHVDHDLGHDGAQFDALDDPLQLIARAQFHANLLALFTLSSFTDCSNRAMLQRNRHSIVIRTLNV
jgi:hypothetical protein